MRQKEKEVCKLFKTWIEFGKDDEKVWLNEGVGCFKIKGGRMKPDLIIWSEKLKGYVAVEVKTAETSKNLIRSFKIVEYWKNYCLGITKYFINNKEIEIKSFCIASPYSLKGKLFETDSEIIKTKKMDLARSFMFPPLEFRRSKDLIRILWEVRNIHLRLPECQDSCLTKAGLGAILSKTLYDETKMKYGETCSPIIFHQRYKKTNRGKFLWLQEVLII